MKEVIFDALIVLLFTGLSSCCTKMYCIGADDMNKIQFFNFTNDDLDTIIVKQFVKNAGFISVLDSFMIITDYFPNGTDYKTINLSNTLTANFDYKIEVLGTEQVFTISGFSVKKKRCNTGFLCNDYFNTLESYEVNGQKQHGAILSITK